MKNYERPAVVMAEEPAEGVYMFSSGETFSLRDTVEPVTDPYEYAQDVAAAENAAGGAQGSVGGEPETDVEGDIAESEIPEETPEDVPEDAGTEADAQPEETPGEVPDAVPDDPDAGAAAKPDPDAEEPENDGLAEDAQMQASARITCESRYMNGVWQGAREGAWGGMKLGCREVLGCTGCPADTGDGCGLQKSGSNRYFNMIGSLKPRWEASGKGPNDDPYGI